MLVGEPSAEQGGIAGAFVPEACPVDQCDDIGAGAGKGPALTREEPVGAQRQLVIDGQCRDALSGWSRRTEA